MIDRYSRPEMNRIWKDTYRFYLWMRVELVVCEMWMQKGLVSRKEMDFIKRKSRIWMKKQSFPVDKVRFYEKTTRHELIAFLKAWTDSLGRAGRWIHYGLTSSDVMDTALALQVQVAGKKLLQEMKFLLEELWELAQRYQLLPAMGRTHGMFAEPMMFGMKFLSFFSQWSRNYERVQVALEEMRVGKLSGAVGAHAFFSPALEQQILKKLELRSEPISTQVLPRDRFAYWVQALALCGSSLEHLCVEMRHLQRSEVGEVEEPFSKGQKGSSAMPHKRNPIGFENLTGCARLLRTHAQAALENVALWHERDISHSSVERVILPDSAILLDYALGRMRKMLKGLHVFSPKVEGKVKKVGPIALSGHVLLKLVEKGVARQEAYTWIQSCAFQSQSDGKEFLKHLLNHVEISKRLSAYELKQCFSLKRVLRHVPAIYKRVKKVYRRKKP